MKTFYALLCLGSAIAGVVLVGLGIDAFSAANSALVQLFGSPAREQLIGLVCLWLAALAGLSSFKFGQAASREK